MMIWWPLRRDVPYAGGVAHRERHSAAHWKPAGVGSCAKCTFAHPGGPVAVRSA